MPKKQQRILDLIGQNLAQADGAPALRSAGLSAIAIALFSTTVALPAEWLPWFRWPLYGMFLAGMPRTVITLIR